MRWLFGRARLVFTQTHAERRASRQGLDIFFGALIGANLGTIDDMPLEDYASLVAMLAGAGMVLRNVGAARRGMTLVMVVAYVGLLALLVLRPDIRPAGVGERDLLRVYVTLGAWLVGALVVELTPVIDERTPREPD